MRTDDKVVATTSSDVNNNHNTRDQRRVGIWWLVVVFLTMLGLMALGGGHAPNVHSAHESSEMGGTSGNVPVDQNPPHFDVNRPVGVVEWPGMVGQKTTYLTGQGNTPADAQVKTGVSAGVSPDTATDEASRKKATSGSTPSDSMPPPSTDSKAGTGPGASGSAGGASH